ncbi:uncharacterized protein LOC107692945 isoform X2 [Sinocyclocheilus anshuiensis]|uniref:uncharacterized protein LOC107692945 isoform X2 n=1 Tax=Sinocyclocheilus anshuiensis TaxID=1608454 RepID=UPI0007B7BD07|nr:PREDICTED: uncharacterized protein LOC107692945 isoform X2 [Sinocyclocheilus anshuiensis]
MIVRKASSGKNTGRNVTPMRAASYNFQRHGAKRSAQRGRQLSKLKAYGCNKDSSRAIKAGGRCLNGQSLISGCRRGHAEGMSTPSASKDFSQDSTSLTMPSGVSSFLLDCLDVDSPASNTDSTLSSIEEFRKTDNYDEGTALLGEDGMMNTVKNSTLLDHSHAQELALQQPPNLSSILELSLNPAEEKSFSLSPICLSPLRVPSETLASDIASGCVLKSANERTPVNTRVVVLSPVVKKCFAEKEKPIKCRKVTFSDIVSIRNVSSHKRGKTDHQDSGVKLVQASGSVSVEPRDISSWPVTFFDFANEREREAFFQRLKQTRSFKFPAKPITSV